MTPSSGQPSVAERRVTSVLFADLVGFTPLSESRDAEEVRELLSRYFAVCRTVLGRYGGTVEKFIGDAVMAVWGVPVTHEDDAERSVRAGLELVGAVAALGDEVGAPTLEMRVGVVTGVVAVTLGATAEGMVAGDAVNTAARVQSVAEPGTVWVDEATKSRTSASIAYSDAGEHALKGKAEPVQLWQARAVVAELGGGQRVDGLEAPLTGRDRELRLLKELFHSTQETSRPRLVVLDGEAGVGKSRLVWEFEKYIDGLTATIRWHRGRCLSYGDGVAFWALAEAFRSRLGLTEADQGEVVGERLDETLGHFVPDVDERDRLRSRLAALLGVGTAVGFPREDLFAAWTAFLERLAEDGNAVTLVIDDAQYADEGLLAFVDHLLATARAGIFVLALARPELLAGRPDLGGRRTTVIRLDPLDDVAMGALVDGLVEGLPETTRAALVARAEGVPLFAVETVRALIDRDAVVPRDGRYLPADGVVVDLESIGAPASMQALVAARLDALTPDERRVVADASVLGVSFTRVGLIAVGSDVSDAVLNSLTRKEILAVDQDRLSAERGQYRFVQSVVRQVAYATQSRRDRKRRHLAAADHLFAQPDAGGELAVVIAQHLLDAVDASAREDPDVAELSTAACELLERAGTRSKNLGSPTESRRLFETALARTTEPTDQARLHLAAADAAQEAGDYHGSIPHCTTAVELFDRLGDPVQAGLAAGLYSYNLVTLSDTEGALAVAEPRWQSLVDTQGAERALIRLAQVLGTVHYGRGEFALAREYVERRLLLAEAIADPDLLGHAMNALGVYFGNVGAPETARGLIETSAAIARSHDRPATMALALNNLSTILMGRNLAAAVETLTEGVGVARRAGVAGMVDYNKANLVAALWTAGRLSDARAAMIEAKETTTIPSIHTALTLAEAWLSDAFGEPMPVAPDPPEADGKGSEWDQSMFASFDVTCRLSEGRLAGLAALAEAALPHVLAINGIDDDFMHIWPDLVRAALAEGDVDAAQRLLAPVENAGRGIVSPAVAAHFLLLRGRVGAARGDDAASIEGDLRAGIAAFEAYGAVGFRARAEEDLARWLVGVGRSDEAAALVDRARSTYIEIGAAGWRSRLDAWHRSGSYQVAPSGTSIASKVAGSTTVQRPS